MKRVALFLRDNKAATLSSAASMVVALAAAGASAADPVAVGIDASVVTGAFTTAVNSTITMMAGLLPVGLTVFATVWGVRKAIRFFKATTN